MTVSPKPWCDLVPLVAKALGLKEGSGEYWDPESRRTLSKTGNDLFDPFWQARCRDWLLERTYAVLEMNGDGAHVFWCEFDVKIAIDCPAPEFCIRAVAQCEVINGQEKATT